MNKTNRCLAVNFTYHRLLFMLVILIGIIQVSVNAEEEASEKALALSMNIGTPLTQYGPNLIILQLSNNTDRDLELFPILRLRDHITFVPPDGWKIHNWESFIFFCNGMLPPRIALPGHGSIAFPVYLNEYFDYIAPGKTTLSCTLNVSRVTKVNEEGIPVTLSTKTTVVIAEDNLINLEKRLAETRDYLQTETNPQKKEKAVEGLLSLRTELVVPVLLLALPDRSLQKYHSKMRDHICAVMTGESDWSDVVSYIRNHGGRYDFVFFTHWQEKKIRLPLDQIRILWEAPDLWCRLYCMETFGEEGVGRPMVDSYYGELKDLVLRAQKIHPDVGEKAKANNATPTPKR